MRTNLLKNLLFAKYFISVAATSKKLRNLAYQKPNSGGDVKFPIYLKKAEDLLSFPTYLWKPLVHVKSLFEWLFEWQFTFRNATSFLLFIYKYVVFSYLLFFPRSLVHKFRRDWFTCTWERNSKLLCFWINDTVSSGWRFP